MELPHVTQLREENKQRRKREYERERFFLSAEKAKAHEPWFLFAVKNANDEGKHSIEIYVPGTKTKGRLVAPCDLQECSDYFESKGYRTHYEGYGFWGSKVRLNVSWWTGEDYT